MTDNQRHPEYHSATPISYPYLWVLHEKAVPSPIFAVAATGIARWKSAQLPTRWLDDSWQAHLEDIKTIIKCHLREELTFGPFGKATGFQWVCAKGTTVFLTKEGDFLREDPVEPPWPATCLTLK